MMRRWLKRLGVLVAVIAVILAWDPIWPYRPEKAAPAITALAEPFQRVEALYYLDGGSISVDIEDANGTRRVFWFQIDRRRWWNRYPTAEVAVVWDYLPVREPDPYKGWRWIPESQWPDHWPDWPDGRPYRAPVFREIRPAWSSKMTICEILRRHEDDWKDNSRIERMLRGSVRQFVAPRW